MPKPLGRDNRRGGKPRSIKDLLSRSSLGGAAVAETRAADDALAWLRGRLPTELAGHIASVSEREGKLVVYAESAAWSARLRYAVAECWTALQAERPQLRDWAVKVQPAAASAGART